MQALRATCAALLLPLLWLLLALLTLPSCSAARPAEETAAPQGPGHRHQALRQEPGPSRVR